LPRSFSGLEKSQHQGGLDQRLTGRAVHICVDMQGLFSPEGPWAVSSMDAILPAISRIAGHAPAQTIFTRFIPPVEPEDLPGAWRRYYERWRQVTRACLDPALLELVPPLRALATGGEVIDKQVYSPFIENPLVECLRARGADTLIITGLETDVCVLATVLGAVDRGFRVVIVSDAVCSSSEVGHEAVLTLYRSRFSEQIEVAPTAVVLASWNVQEWPDPAISTGSTD
jgi:nicotinamidase-related amidase